MSDNTDLSEIIIAQMDRHDRAHRDLMQEIGKIRDEQVEQGKTLVRNTVSLEEHIRRTNLLEKKVAHVEEQVGNVNKHVEKMKMWMSILKPTKTKLKWLLLASALATGSYGTKDYLENGELTKQIKELIRSE
jgi:hypothetical protein